MSLGSGTQLGPYEILSPLGSGGMGDVYRAKDTRLHREVALKVLPDRFALDRDRMTRFAREAQLLASLNHPNIAAIYGVEDAGDRSALVLELVDGETLAQRIAKGPIRVEEALRTALQIAEALEAAHEKSIIHRDLKPANVKITSQGTVKVLDFGLAKALEDEAASASNLSQSPTLTAAATGAGIILGTAGYMAPEQARGKHVDRRADIWAFGVTLFEMISGQRAFDGETVNDTIAKVLERDPDWQLLPPQTPLDVRKLLRHCLTKNVKDRLQAIGDARTLIQDLLTTPETLNTVVQTSSRPVWQKWLPWAIAPLFLAAGWLLKPANVPRADAITRFQYVLPNELNLMHSYRHGVDLSSDGKQIAFVAGSVAGAETGFPNPGRTDARSIYVKRVDQWDAIPVPGTEKALNPFFSPDGQWLGFFSGNQLKKVPLAGGAAVVLVENVNTSPLGVTWGKNGTIVFAPTIGSALKSLPDTGGEPQDFTQLDKNANEVSHRLPHFLPDGTAVLFSVLPYSNVAPDWKRSQLWAKVLKTGERKLVLENALDGRYDGNGHLVFARQGKLFAIRFDPESLAVSGSAVPVVDGVTHAAAGIGPLATSGVAQFSISENGSLLYAPGSTEPPVENNAVWVGRDGKVSAAGTKPMSHGSVRIAPDGKRIALTEYNVDNRVIWLFDPARGTQERQTFDGLSSDPVWSPDGQRFVFRSSNSGPMRLYIKSLSAPEPTPLTSGPIDYPGSFTADGKELIFSRAELGIDGPTYDIYVVSIDDPSKSRPLLNSQFSETYPTLSPDGRWLAYCSNESGRSELYVQPYPGPGKRITVSTDGGTEPAWSVDGKELFYRKNDATMAVAFRFSEGEPAPEKPVLLFRGLYLNTIPARMYDVARDGRFLMIQTIPEQVTLRAPKIFPSALRMILNWKSEIEATTR